MKISIVGGGNMGGAIARGLSTCDLFRPQDITVINRRASKTADNTGVQSGIAGRYGRLQLSGYGRHRDNRRETLDGGGTDKRASDREAAR